MYTRYIPQSDGSFRRSRMQDVKPVPPPVNRPQPSAYTEPPPATPCPEPQSCPRMCQKEKHILPPRHNPPKDPTTVGSFLKQLLPKSIDTEDLLIILLLLLMSGDCREDQNTALLTLALYLFL